MSRYSALSLLRGAFNGQKHWQPAWRDPEPKKHYDIIIIGGGGHGLATAYYLAKVHGLKNIAVLEKTISAAAIPGGTRRLCVPTTARNRCMICSNSA
jgi:heterodisulfide reductase subunit A-like polyferredoxin